MPAFREVARTTLEQGGHRIQWERNTAEDAQTARSVNELLQRDLTVDAAVQVALLGSPHLRSTFEELSIAQADLVQAGLLKNPVFTIGRTAWDSDHLDPNLFAAVEEDFLDIVTMPLRKRIAQAELETVKLEVADEVLKLASEVRSAFYVAQAAEQVATMQRMVRDAAETSAEIALHQHDAGNMSDLALRSEQGLASRARLDLHRGEGEAAVSHERLTRLMGLWGERVGWKLAGRLPELPKREVSLEHLESLAVEKRLDIKAARHEVQSLGDAASLAKTTRWTGVVNVSVEVGRLRGTKHLSFGPAVSLEIPLFDQRQASIARLEAFQRQAEDNMQALAVEVRSDVRSSRVRLSSARSIVEEYRQVLVPLREDIVKYSQQSYDAMLLGVYQLIQAKENEFETYREYIQALRDYWIARSDLERAIGTRLAVPVTDEPSQVPSAAPASSSTPRSGVGHEH